MEIKKSLQIRFKTDTKYGELNDSIYCDPDKPLTDEEIETEIQSRVSKYETLISTAEPYEPTKKELEAEVAKLDELKAEYLTKISEISVMEK